MSFAGFNSPVMGNLKNEDVLSRRDNSLGADIKLQRATRPVISASPSDQSELKRVCPVNAIGINPVRIDMGKCIFCGDCAVAFPSKIKFSNDTHIASNVRDRLVILEGDNTPISPDASIVLKNLSDLALPLRLMVVGNSQAMISLTTSIEFITTPELAHGLLFVDEITEDQEEAITRMVSALLPPKLIILAGAHAISGGVYDERTKSQTGFMNKYPVDLYVPGNPAHPESLTDAVTDFISLKQFPKNNH